VLTPDLILLDVHLPDTNGIELLWEVRKKYRGIVLITAANESLLRLASTVIEFQSKRLHKKHK
jgi:response regulator of citrate/malate metabolism